MPSLPAARLLAALVLLAATIVPVAAQAPERLVVGPAVVEDLKPVFATVESVRVVEARARIGGTLDSLAVREGDAVEAGRVIAVVADPKLALGRAALDARLDALAAQRRQAQLELDRTRQLRLTGAATQARLDEAETAVQVIDAQAAATRAERAVIDQQAREGEVLAPQAGRVLSVHAVAGSVVMPGEPIATVATDRYVLRLRIPERHARFLRAGDPVQVGARGLAPRGGTALGAGRIVLVYPRLDAGQVVADAEVEGLGDFFVGERVEVTIVGDRRATILVPEPFLIRGAGVDLVRLEDGRAIPVQTGPAHRVGDAVLREVLSGLRAGDVVVRP